MFCHWIAPSPSKHETIDIPTLPSCHSSPSSSSPFVYTSPPCQVLHLQEQWQHSSASPFLVRVSTCRCQVLSSSPSNRKSESPSPRKYPCSSNFHLWTYGVCLSQILACSRRRRPRYHHATQKPKHPIPRQICPERRSSKQRLQIESSLHI